MNQPNSNTRQVLSISRRTASQKSFRSSLLRAALQIEKLEHRFALDGSDLVAVLQAPNASNQIAISFNRPVTGVDLSDFSLLQYDAPIDLSAGLLESQSSQDYLLTLPELLNDGEYELQLLAENSGITDEADPLVSLLDDAMLEWTRDTLAPTLAFTWALPTIAEPTPMRIAALGDSQTTEVGSSYVPFLRQELSSDEYAVEVFAEAGWQAPQVQQLWDSSVKDANYDVAVFFAGVNDLISTDRTPEQIFATLSTMFDEALARDMTVVAVGVSPWSNYEASNALKQARTTQLNTLIAQYASDHPTQVRFVDSLSALRSTLDSQRLSTRYDSGDGLHFLSPGDQRLASLIANAINELRPVVVQSASVTVHTSEPVTGFSESNFRLLRDGVEHPYTTVTLEPWQFRFDFDVPENDKAEYKVEWIGTEPLVDLVGNPLASETTSTTQIDRQVPTAQLVLPQASVSHQTTDAVTIQFSEPISGLTVSDFQLFRGSDLIDLSQATLTELTADSYSLNLMQLASRDGTYRLILNSGDSEIQDLNGNALRSSAIVNWVQLRYAPALVDGLLTISTTNQTESVEANIFGDHLELWINGLNTQFSLENVGQIQLNTLFGAEDFVSIELMSAPDQPPVSPWLSISLTSIATAARLSLYGIASSNALQSTATTVMLSNSLFTAQATGFATVQVYGGSNASAIGFGEASLTGSSAIERFIGRPGLSQWTTPAYQLSVHDFESVSVQSSGGNDTATLYDSVGDDLYTGTSTLGQLSGTGYSLQVSSFETVSVISSQGLDTATLIGTPGVDTFISQPQSNALYGSGYRHNVNNFDNTEAIGNGGSDVATFYDTAGNDTVELSPLNGRLTGPGVTNVARQFPRINAFSRFGSDSVRITGSSSSDIFTGQESSSALTGAGYGLYTYRFASTTAVGNGGNDTARLYDSAADDRFDSTPLSATLTTPTYTLTAEQFPVVYAYGRSGNDLAFLNGTTAVETYNGYATYGAMISGNRTQFAYGFDRVSATGGGGADIANLYDSNDNDTLISSPGQAQLTGPGFQHIAIGFTRTNSYARAGNDTAELNGSTGIDQFNGQTTASFVRSEGLSNYAYGFDRVTSNGMGGNDTALIYDSTGDDILVSTSQWTSLQSGAFSNTVTGYSRTNVYARSGYDTATMIGTAAVETFSGQTSGSSMIGTGFANYAYAFDAVVAESAGGADTANLYDSTGDDMFIATATSATLSGNGYLYTANAFSRVNAYGRSGNDMAILIGSTRSETVVVRPEYTYIKMATYLNYASGFDSVSISGGGGNDSAYLYDSAGNDQLRISYRSAMLFGIGFMASLDGFYRINAYASVGNDRVTLSDSVGNDTYTGRTNLGTLTSSGFTANLESFDTVVLAPAIGGTNTLDTANLTYTMEVGLGWQ